MNRLIVDTDIIIDVIRNNSKAISFLQNAEKDNLLALSEITNMELIIGCRNKNELIALKKFMRRFEIISLNELVGKKASELIEIHYLSHNLHIPDAINASISIVFDIPFVTKNRRDYSFIKELNLLRY